MTVAGVGHAAKRPEHRVFDVDVLIDEACHDALGLDALDVAAFKKLGFGKQQLVVLVHSGSRGLGESILRPHVDQHFGNGVEADSFAAEEYLRGHDFAVR